MEKNFTAPQAMAHESPTGRYLCSPCFGNYSAGEDPRVIAESWHTVPASALDPELTCVHCGELIA